MSDDDEKIHAEMEAVKEIIQDMLLRLSKTDARPLVIYVQVDYLRRVMRDTFRTTPELSGEVSEEDLQKVEKLNERIIQKNNPKKKEAKGYGRSDSIEVA